jgi:hypothetical protein
MLVRYVPPRDPASPGIVAIAEDNVASPGLVAIAEVNVLKGQIHM